MDVFDDGLFETKDWKLARDEYLRNNEYADIGEWALDSNYCYNNVSGIWFDENYSAVNIELEFYYALEAAGYFD